MQQQQQQQHEGAAWPQAQGPVFWPNSSSSPGGAAAAPAPAPAGLCQPPSARQAARLRVRMLPYLASCISSVGRHWVWTPMPVLQPFVHVAVPRVLHVLAG
eukprot:1161229-Pelagomonas_calceolata.AAC.4